MHATIQRQMHTTPQYLVSKQSLQSLHRVSKYLCISFQTTLSISDCDDSGSDDFGSGTDSAFTISNDVTIAGATVSQF